MQQITQYKDDNALIELLENNPREAVGHIIDKYGGALYTVIYKVVHSEEVARDLFQDSCVKVWKNADKYDRKKGRLFTWLLNICRNTTIALIGCHCISFIVLFYEMIACIASHIESTTIVKVVGLFAIA